MMPAIRPAQEADDEAYANPHATRGSRYAAAGEIDAVRTGVSRAIVPTDTAELLARQGLGRVAVGDARAELAERLKRAWVSAGRPSMTEVGDEVGYSKASISKVLSGKMAPAWHLVRKLGDAFGVPADTIRGEWHSLWMVADELRRQRPAETDARSAERPCPRCGSWVADPRRHDTWHAELTAFLHAAPPDVSPGRIADSYQWASLRDSLPRRDE